MDIDQKIIEYYTQGCQPILIADRLGMEPAKVRSRVQKLRKKGIIVNYTRGKGDRYERESTVRKIYLDKQLKSGSMSSMLDQMSHEVQDYYIEKTINEGYKTIAEMVSDVLIDHYFDVVQEK